MGKNYTIRDGFSFRDDNGGVKVGGETVYLEDDVALEHAHKLEEVVKKSRQPSKPPASGSDGTGDQGGTEPPADSGTPADPS